MAENNKAARLTLQLVDRVSNPAGKIRADLLSLSRTIDNLSKRDLGKALRAPNVAPMSTALAKADRQIAAARQARAAGAREVADAESGLVAGLRGGPAAAVVGAAAAGGAAAYKDFATDERRLTRLGLVFGATREELAALRQEALEASHAAGAPIEAALTALEGLAAAGNDLATARKALPAMVKAAQATDASGGDIASTFDAASKSMAVAADRAGELFDTIAAGSQIGKFEAKDMARYLPSLFPVAARAGYTGTDGARQVVAQLEVLRDYVGTSEEAVSAYQDFWEKIYSPDVEKNFKDFGIDLPAELKSARAAGEDLLVTMNRLLQRATKGDAALLPKLFGDRESRRFAGVILSDFDRFGAAAEKLKTQAGGTVELNIKVLSEDAQSRIDNLGNSWNQLVKDVGAGIAIGATPVLDAINSDFDAGRAYRAGLDKEEARGGSEKEARAEYDRRYTEANPEFSWWNPMEQRERSEAFSEAVQALGRGQVSSIYQELDAVLQARKTMRFPDLEAGRKAADALAAREAERRATNIDQAEVRRGIPKPAPRPAAEAAAAPVTPAQSMMSMPEQRASYGAGRELAAAEMAKIPERLPTFDLAVNPLLDPGSVPLMLEPKIDPVALDRARAQAGKMQDAAPPPIAPPFDVAAASTAIGALVAKAKAAGVDMLGSLGIDVSPVVSTTSIDAAAALAASTGPLMRAALSITARPVVDSSSIDSAAAKANVLRAQLSALSNSLAATGSMPVGAASPRLSPMPQPPHRAVGGAVRRGHWYEVNEKGREYFNPGSNGTITPNHKTGGGTTINNSFSIVAHGDGNELYRQLNSKLRRSGQIGLDGR